ncbi:MAG: dienelactone hydrolase family protein [Proteobacteria bacterium]|nr:dienelactone hydrolase family protein [Pseudomonadota bacterium]
MREQKPVLTQDVINLYDHFTHGGMDRRVFLDRLTRLVGGAAAAQGALALLQSNYAMAQVVPENDPRLMINTLTYAGPNGPMSGYLCRLKGGAKRPAVLVIHENRGLNPHIRDVTRRLALDGFLAYGIDALTPEGGTPADEDKARDMFGKIDINKTGENVAAAVGVLAKHAESTGKVGAVGFCWGGGMVNQVAWRAPELAASVPYYGIQPPLDKVPLIKAAMLIHYAGTDERINAGIEAYRKALTDAGKTFEIFIYEGTQHAFNNDTGAARYNKAAADLAWGRTLAHFRKYLGEPPKGA